MKFLRFQIEKEEKKGILEKGRVKIIKSDFLFDNFSFTGEEIDIKEIKEFLPPVSPPNVIALGLNYKDHAKESGNAIPKEPVIFLKSTTSITGHLSPIILPKEAPEFVDYEAELVIVIGKKVKNVNPEMAKEYILGYTCGNDITARDCQLKKDIQWARSKSFDTFCPIGPWIETEIEPTNLNIKSILNGKIMQNSNTSEMIFSVFEIVSYVSKQMTLLPGTIIMTGTPSGVGFAKDNPVFLKEDDVIEIEIEKIGCLKNFVKKEN